MDTLEREELSPSPSFSHILPNDDSPFHNELFGESTSEMNEVAHKQLAKRKEHKHHHLIPKKLLEVGWKYRIQLGVLAGLIYIFAGAFIMWRFEQDDGDEPPNRKEWNYLNAIYFCVISLTTIGYGDISPETPGGRVFFMFYASFGLVLVGITVASVAAEVLKFISIGRLQFQIIAFFIFDKIRKCFHIARVKTRKNTIPNLNGDVELKEVVSAQDKNYSAPKDRGCIPVILDKTQSIIKVGIDFFFSPQSTIGIAATFLLAMLFSGASIFWILEQNLSYIDSIYFCFVTLSTIGFGDITPSNKASKAFVSIYALLGLGMLAVLIGEIVAVFAKLASERIQKAEDSLTISQLEDKVSWGAEDIITHMQLRALQLNLSPRELRSLIGKLKVDMEDYYEDFCGALAMPSGEIENEKERLKKQIESREISISGKRPNP